MRVQYSELYVHVFNQPAGAIPVRGAFFGVGDGDILLDDVACLGNETKLVNCDFDGIPFCTHSEDAGVICATGKFSSS